MSIQQGDNTTSYSLINTPSVIYYDQSCKQTNHSLITFIGIEGFFEILIVDGPVDSGWIIFISKFSKNIQE